MNRGMKVTKYLALNVDDNSITEVCGEFDGHFLVDADENIFSAGDYIIHTNRKLLEMVAKYNEKYYDDIDWISIEDDEVEICHSSYESDDMTLITIYPLDGEIVVKESCHTYKQI